MLTKKDEQIGGLLSPRDAVSKYEKVIIFGYKVGLTNIDKISLLLKGISRPAGYEIKSISLATYLSLSCKVGPLMKAGWAS